jgi:quinoprotein glucose dehydrogenase
MLPSAAGGANWRGAAVDPETGVLYVPSMTLVMVNGLRAADPARSGFRYVYGAGFLVPGPEGLPLVKPPWGRITAIDLNRGEHLWQVPHGSGPKDHPALAGLDLPDLGSNPHGVLSNGGLVLTKTLLFIIQAELDESSMLRMGDAGYLRAYDKRTGEKVWEHHMTPTPHGTPMTYLHQGRQYLVVAVGGMTQKAELVAFALPEVRPPSGAPTASRP